MMRSALYKTNMPHSDTLSWFWANLILHAKQKSNKYQFHSLWFHQTGIESTIYHTQREHANPYTTDVVRNAKYALTSSYLQSYQKLHKIQNVRSVQVKYKISLQSLLNIDWW